MTHPAPLWSATELAAVFKTAPLSSDVDGVSIDSRAVTSGELFIALSGDPGPRFNGGAGAADARDGHAYIESAVSHGASLVMRHDGLGDAEATIAVEDTLDGLWALGKAARARINGKTVAVTGSSGKTTLRAWFESVLAPMGKTHASTGSLNNHWGVPLSLARMPADIEFGVFEVGTNHPGEIAPLSQLVEPDVALLLNVLPAHIGNFPDMDSLKQEKLSIAAGLKEGGVLVMPHALKDEFQSVHFSGRRVVTFGFADSNVRPDVTAEIIEHDDTMAMIIDVMGQSVECQVPFKGPERAQSIMALFAVCHSLNLPLESVAQNLSQLPLPEGRGNLLEIGGVRILDDSYNANPASMQMALRNLEEIKVGTGRRIALVGEMLELGELGESAHQDTAIATQHLDEVVSFGPGFKHVPFPVKHRHFDALTDFDLAAFVSTLDSQDVVLVKGSNRVFWVNGFVRSFVRLLREKSGANN